MPPAWKIIITYFVYNICMLAVAGIIGLACVIVVYRKTRCTQTLSSFTLFLYAVTVGFAAIITMLFALALVGLLTKIIIFSTFGLSILAAYIYTVKNSSFFKHQLAKPYQDNFNNTLYYFSLSGTLVIALFTILTNVHITGFSDSTSFHLPYARFFLENSGLATNVNLRYPYHSLNGSLLYSFALTFANSIYCQTLHSLFGVLTALVVFSFAITAGVASPIAMLAASGFLSLEIFVRQSAVADVDLFLGFFTTMCIYTAILWGKNRNDHLAFFISALSLGMAMGTKYLGALHAIPIAIFIIYHTRSIRSLLTYAFIAALFGLWWYVRSLLITGNPIHPFAPNIFGYYLWNEADMAAQMQGLSGFVAKTFSDFFMLPKLFGENSFAYTGMQYWLYGFYFAPLFWLWLSPTSKALMLFSWPFLAFWFCTSQVWRYIIPLAPLAIIICCDMAQITLNQLYRFARKLPGPKLSLISLQPIISGLILAYIFQQATLCFQQIQKARFWLITEQQQTIFLRKFNHEYDLVAAANQYFSKDQQVFLFCCFDKTYFVNAHEVGEHFGVNRSTDFSNPLHAAFNKNQPDKMALQTLTDKFAALHIDGFILDNNNMPADQQALDKHFEKLYTNAAGSVYRINPL